MDTSLRSAFTAAVSTVAISALTLTPVMLPPAPPPAVAVASTAATSGLTSLSPRPTPEMLQAAAAAAEAVVAAANGSRGLTQTQLTPVGQSATAAPPVAHTTAAPATADPAPVPLNAASDVIDAVYSFTRFWANYVALDLGPWLINWIPFGYLVSDQINIWYSSFVLPVVDSFVYQFLDPVVNNPLNLGVWLDGFGAMASTAVNGVISGISQEITYVLTGGWLPFPVPWPTAARTAPATTDMVAASALAPAEKVAAEHTPVAPADEQKPARIRHTIDPATAPPVVDATVTDPDAVGEPAITGDDATADSDDGAPAAPAKRTPGRKTPKSTPAASDAPAGTAPAAGTAAAPAKAAGKTRHDDRAGADRPARATHGKTKSAN